MSDLQIVCGLISTVCTVVWIINQLFWYCMFKNHFERQDGMLKFQERLYQLHIETLKYQLTQQQAIELKEKYSE